MHGFALSSRMPGCGQNHIHCPLLHVTACCQFMQTCQVTGLQRSTTLTFGCPRGIALQNFTYLAWNELCTPRLPMAMATSLATTPGRPCPCRLHNNCCNDTCLLKYSRVHASPTLIDIQPKVPTGLPHVPRPTLHASYNNPLADSGVAIHSPNSAWNMAHVKPQNRAAPVHCIDQISTLPVRE
jgi:hypothetical protein